MTRVLEQGLVAVAVTTLACGGAVRPPAVHATLQVLRYQLDNGVRVALVPDPDATLVTMVVRYGVGAVDDPAGQEGVAHLAAHVLYDEHVGATSLATQLERIAIGVDVEPRPDETTFLARFQPVDLDGALQLEAVRLQLGCSKLDDAVFAAARADVADEIATHPSWHLNRVVGEAIYGAGDPMRRAYGATAATVAALTRDQVCAFIGRHYAPGNATVVVTGPIDELRLRQALAPLASVASHAFDPAATGSAAMPVGVVTVDADVAEPTIAVAFAIPNDVKERTRAGILVDAVADRLGGEAFTEGRFFVLWMPMGDGGPQAARDKLADRLAHVVDALGVRPRQTWHGNWPVRVYDQFDRGTPEDLGVARDRLLLSRLARLDNPVTRIIAIAHGGDLGQELDAVVHLDEGALRDTLSTSLDLRRAIVLVLRPDGTRPATWHGGLTVADHHTPRRVEPDANAENLVPAVPASMLDRARARRLDNGVRVVLAPTGSHRMVNVRLVFAAGGTGSPQRRVAAIAMSALLRAAVIGSQVRGSLRWRQMHDTVELSFAASADELDDRMTWLSGLAYAARDLPDITDRVIQSLRSPGGHRAPDVARDDAVLYAVFGDHPYGRSPPKDTPPPSVDDVRAFAARYLQPNNATLVIAGDFDPVQLEGRVHDVLDGWQGSGQAEAQPVPAHPGGVAFAIAETAPTVSLQLAWPGGPPDADYAARQTIVEMVYRLQPGLGARYHAHQLAGEYRIARSFAPAHAAEDIVALRDGIAALGDGSLASRQLFAAARRAAVLKEGAAIATAVDWADTLAFDVELGHDLAWRQQLPAAFARVSYDDVQRILAAELAPSSAVWLVSGPKPAVDAVYAGLGLTPTPLDAR